MKTRILSALSLKNCKKELRTIKKISSINHIFKNKKNIYKSLKNTEIYISSASIKVDKKFFRPSEVDILIGNYSKIKNELGWEPQTNIQDLIQIMVEHDIKVYNS